jgi:hypothetical protein
VKEDKKEKWLYMKTEMMKMVMMLICLRIAGLALYLVFDLIWEEQSVKGNSKV